MSYTTKMRTERSIGSLGTSMMPITHSYPWFTLPSATTPTPPETDLNTRLEDVITIYQAAQPQQPQHFPASSVVSTVLNPLPSLPAEWVDYDYRHAIVEANIEQGIAWQIRANREGRGLSQRGLAALLNTDQSAISRWEDPMRGGHNLETLLKLARAFDCALQVRFIPFSELSASLGNVSPHALYASTYPEEIEDSTP